MGDGWKVGLQIKALIKQGNMGKEDQVGGNYKLIRIYQQTIYARL